MKRNNTMKRVLAMLLVIIMVVTGSGIAMAKSGGSGNGKDNGNKGNAITTRNDAKAKALYDLKLFKGTSTSAYLPNLEGVTNRLQGIIMIGNMMHWKDESDFAAIKTQVPSDVVGKSISDIEKKYVAYALEHGITKGVGNGLFGADLPINARMLYTWYARALMGAEVWTDLDKLVDLGFVTAEQLKAMNLTSTLTRDDLVGVMYKSLNWKMKNSDMKLFQYMLKNMWFDYKAAVKAGLTDVEEKELSFNIKQLSEKTLLLTFSHALDEGKAGNKGYYTVQVQSTTSGGAIVATPGAITVSDYSVIASGKEVYIVFDKNLIAQDNEKNIVGDKVSVTPSAAVSSVTDGYTLAKDERTKTITIREDNTKPVVREIHVVTNTQEPKTQLHFVFSEPIKNIAELKTLVTMTKDTTSAFFSTSSIQSVHAGTEAYLSVPTGVMPGNWLVTVVGLQDQDDPSNVSTVYSQYVTIP